MGEQIQASPFRQKVELGALILVRKRLPDVRQVPSINGPERSKIVPCFAQAQRAIGTTPHFVGIVIVLAVIFPEANRTDLVCRKQYEYRAMPVPYTTGQASYPSEGLQGREPGIAS